MKRIRLIVAYDGTNYHGFQKQPNAITIESKLNEAISDLCQTNIEVIGASRTDSGVHAYCNIAVFDTTMKMPAEKFCFALNQRLPEDIRIQYSDEVPLKWHPRKNHCVKTYIYRILNRKIEIPTERLYSHFVYYDIDIDKMKEASSYYIGTHDFVSHCSTKSQATSTVRTIHSIDIQKDMDMITVVIRGDGFLYNMVRIMVGTLLKVGTNDIEPIEIKHILDSKDRQNAGDTMPAKGLCLADIEYLE